MQQDADPSTRPEQPPDSSFMLYSVGFHVPPFWPEKPALLFEQLEGQFALANVTEDATKFYYVISHLDNKYAAEVEDVLTNTLPTGRYERINAELIRRLSVSDEQRLLHLLMHEEMGDRRSTQFLRHLRTLAGPSLPSDFYCTWLKNCLPPYIQAIFTTQARVALDNVAQLMAKIAEVAPPPSVPVSLHLVMTSVLEPPVLMSRLGK